MNPKRLLIALTLALLVSGACTWFVARRMTAPVAQKLSLGASYAAPSRELQSGETLKPEDIEMVAWPASNPVDGGFSKTADLVGREVLFPLGKGQPILDRDLSAAGSGAGLAGKIPDGMRAIALRSDEVVGVAGFLVPGSHLDVLVTFRSDRSPEPVTATVLQNVVVLAAGQQFEPDPNGKPSAVAVVTLLLSPQESERAVLASTQGVIHFILRNGGDDGRTEGAPMLLSALSGEAPVVPPVPPPVVRHTPAPAPKKHEIETILGGSSAAAPTPVAENSPVSPSSAQDARHGQ
jgi:pilus assembly protein CpaB